MEATATFSLSLQSNTWSGFEKSCRNPSGFLRISRKNAVERDLQTLNLQNSRFQRASVRSKHATLGISCSVKKSTALESGSSYVSVDEARTLKNKAEEVVPDLNERCIYLVGMMGSGKTTVGKILSQVLGYSFLDSDKLVEEAVGATSVAQIFEDYSESFFRDNENTPCQQSQNTGEFAVIRFLLKFEQCFAYAVGGVMAFLTLHEMLPLAFDYAGQKQAVKAVFIGMAFMSASLYFLEISLPKEMSF